MMSDLKPIGEVEMKIERSNGEIEIRRFRNTVLRGGKIALASCLTNELGSQFDFYISSWAFGTGGTQGGAPKFVNSETNSLFNKVLSKPIVSLRNDEQAIFTTILTNSDAVGLVLNEMALVLNNGNLYSMVTFPDFTKTSNEQITYSWYISFI